MTDKTSEPVKRETKTEERQSAPKPKMFEVKLKAGHPTNSYQRDGITFTGRFIQTYVPDPVRLDEQQVTPDILADPWLEITEITS